MSWAFLSSSLYLAVAAETLSQPTLKSFPTIFANAVFCVKNASNSGLIFAKPPLTAAVAQLSPLANDCKDSPAPVTAPTIEDANPIIPPATICKLSPVCSPIEDIDAPKSPIDCSNSLPFSIVPSTKFTYSGATSKSSSIPHGESSACHDLTILSLAVSTTSSCLSNFC